jgi:hypothetical protein
MERFGNSAFVYETNVAERVYQMFRLHVHSSNSESKSCRCPSQFSARHVDGTCVCECFDKQRDCIRSKRGKEYLPHDDRM